MYFCYFFRFENVQDVDEGLPDFANMTEEEQIAFAMQMSMQDHGKFKTTKQFGLRIKFYFSYKQLKKFQHNKQNVQNKKNNQWKSMK